MMPIYILMIHIFSAGIYQDFSAGHFDSASECDIAGSIIAKSYLHRYATPVEIDYTCEKE